MKILMLAIGTRGDVQPFIVAGKALSGLGHDVAIAAAGGFAEMIGEAGLAHIPLPVDYQDLLQEPEMRAALRGLGGKLKAYRWATQLMNDQLSALWKLGIEYRPDLIINHFKGSLAPYIARKVGAISIPLMLQPGFKETGDYPQFLISSKSMGGFGNRMSHRLIMSIMRFGTGMMTRRWQKATDTDIGPRMDVMQGYNPSGAPLRVHAYSPTLVPRPADWPQSEVQTGYLFAGPADYNPPSDLNDFLTAGPAPVYFGFGSMPGMDPNRLSAAVNGAVDKLGLRAVVATGWGGLGSLQRRSNLHVLDAAPHSWLFQRVSAAVHHGGSGTTHEALRWGLPAVVCPLFADQPFFGQRIHDLGAGPAFIRQGKLTADNLAAALEVALSAPAKSRAAELGRQIRKEAGVENLCALVDRLT